MSSDYLLARDYPIGGLPGTLNNQFFDGGFNWMIPNLYIKNH